MKKRIRWSSILSEKDVSKILIEYESGLGCQQIADKFLMNRYAIQRILKRAGVKTRTLSKAFKLRKGTTFNENCFCDISDPVFAYYYGSFLGDGSYSFSRHTIQVGLQGKDIDILEKLKEYTGSSHVISKRFAKSNFAPLGTEVVSFNISDKRTVDTFVALGFEPRKTGKEKVPEVFKENPHFWRGILEADGYLGTIDAKRKGLYTGKPAKALTLCNSEFVCESFIYIVNKITKDDSPIRVVKYRNVTEPSVRAAKAKIFLDWVYAEPVITLNRKYNIYKEVWCKDDKQEN